MITLNTDITIITTGDWTVEYYGTRSLLFNVILKYKGGEKTLKGTALCAPTLLYLIGWLSKSENPVNFLETYGWECLAESLEMVLVEE